MKKTKNNIISFPSDITQEEREVEAILFVAEEPLELDTIESRVSKKKNILRALEKLKKHYLNRGINLVCISNKWSFRTSDKLSNLMSQQKSVQKKLSKAAIEPLSIIAFRKYLREKMKILDIEESFVKRYLNEGFSGGEKKKSEILQMAVLKPKIAVLDETDSGLDIDALKIVSAAINTMSGPDLGILLITHYQRILKYVKPKFVHVLIDGRIVKSGSMSLAEELENKGYDWIRESL